MTAPDAPTAMTLEEATALHGLTFARNLDDSAWIAGRIRFLSPHDHGKYAHSWEPLGVGATWAEAASQALGRPVVPRDPTAELVAENTELRRILSECVTAAGGAAAPTCSLEFFAEVPREIAAVRAKDTAELRAAVTEWAEAEAAVINTPLPRDMNPYSDVSSARVRRLRRAEENLRRLAKAGGER